VTDEERTVEKLSAGFGHLAETLEALGFDPGLIARAMVIEGVARGRQAHGMEAWTQVLSEMANHLAKREEDG
jgi:hypothetical protein